MDSMYEGGTYWCNNPDFHASDSDWKAKHLFSVLLAAAGGSIAFQDMKLCEVGCGAGGVLAHLSSLIYENMGISCDCVGYDISPAAIDKARSLYPDIRFEVSKIEKIQEHFDILLLIDVLEHLEEPDLVLSHCLNIATSILIHIPLDYHYWGMVLRGKGYFDYLKHDRGHIRYFTKNSAFKLVKSARGKIISWKYTPWGIEHDFDRSSSGKLAKCLRRIGFELNMDFSVKLLGGASLAILCSRDASK